MSQDQACPGGDLDGFAILALVLTFSVRAVPPLHLLFRPFLDNVHVYGPIFSEVSRLAGWHLAPFRTICQRLAQGFPLFDSPHFSILYPFVFISQDESIGSKDLPPSWAPQFVVLKIKPD